MMMTTTFKIATISSSTVSLSLTIFKLQVVKPKPAWAVNPTVVFYSRPCWRYLLGCGLQLRSIGQFGLKIILVCVLAFFLRGPAHDTNKGLQSFCPSAGVSISDNGRAIALLKEGDGLRPSFLESLYFLYMPLLNYYLSVN